MDVFDQMGNPLEDYDLSRGRLEPGIRTVHHDAVEGVPEQGHYVTVREYPNGGKDVAWVVDVPGVEPRPAYDEDVPMDTYIPYTEREMAANAAKERIAELKAELAATDYAVIKIAEGAATQAEYGEVIARRQAWRAEINRLEAAAG